MALNTPMITRRVRRLLIRAVPTLTSLAKEHFTLCPEENRPGSHAVYLDDALERVTALSPWRTWDVELALIRGNPVPHAASIAYVIENVDLVGAFLYKGPAKAQPGFGRESWMLADSETTPIVDEARLVTSTEGSHFFGPLLQSDFPLELIAPNDQKNFTVATRPYEHSAAYRRLFSLPPERRLTRARFRRLIVYSDFAQNSFKIARYVELRRRLRTHVSPVGRATTRGVYLSRGRTGELRVLSNERSIIEFLDAQGFEILEPATLSADEIAARTLNAPLVISVEGSHLSHAIFSLKDAGTMLVLQPPDRFAMPYKEFTDSLGMRFAFLVGLKTGDGFEVPIEELRFMLDRLS